MSGFQIGIIGCGRWGRILLRNFRCLTQVPLVVDPRSDALTKDLQGEFPSLSIVSEMETFLDDPDLNIAVIASPAETHYDLTRRCLDAGKDVFVEKPFTLSSVQAQELVTQARLCDRILMVGHKYLFHPALGRLKAGLDHRALGACVALVAHRLGWWGIVPANIGALWHLGSHEVSIFQYLFGETAQEGTAMGVSILDRKEHDLVTATLRYPSGAIGMFQLGLSHPEKIRRLFAIGESAAFRFDDLARDKLTKWENLHPDPTSRFDDRIGVLEGGRPVAYAQGEPVLQECRHFLTCVRDRLEPTGSGETAVAVIRTLEALSESLHQGGRIVAV